MASQGESRSGGSPVRIEVEYEGDRISVWTIDDDMIHVNNFEQI
jgi:hypothetical protein